MKSLPGIKLFDLSGKAAIITGGSKGLGLAMAAGLASAGANVMLVNRNQEQGQAAAKEIAENYPVKAISFSGDVTNADDMVLMAEEAIKTFKYSR